MGAVMKGIVIAAEFAAVNRAKIIKTNERCCCFAIPRINFDSHHVMKVQNVQAVQPLRSVQIVGEIRNNRCQINLKSANSRRDPDP